LYVLLFVLLLHNLEFSYLGTITYDLFCFYIHLSTKIKVDWLGGGRQGKWVIGGRLPRIEDAGDICLTRPRPTHNCRANDDDNDDDDDGGGGGGDDDDDIYLSTFFFRTVLQ
jgi:hypothetical protein